MPAISRKRRWRKSDDSEIVAALHRQATAAEVEREGADCFEEDVVGKRPTRAALRLVKRAVVDRKVHKKDSALAERFAAIKAEHEKRKLEKKQAADLWGARIAKGDAEAPVTKRFAKMPAVIAPKHGVSANPEKGEWIDNLAEQAAIAREFYEQTASGLDLLDQSDDSSSDIEVASEKNEKIDEDEKNPPAEVKQEILDEVDAAFVVRKVKPKKPRSAEQRRGDMLKRMRADLKALPKILEEVDTGMQQAENTRAYKAQRSAERERLLSEGVLPDGHIKVGKKKYIESGSDVILPADLETAGGSLRKLVVPPTNTALRERAASFIKRGMTEIVRTRVCKKINTKVHTRVRLN